MISVLMRGVMTGGLISAVALTHAARGQTYPSPANFPLCVAGTASGGAPSQYCLGPADQLYEISVRKVGFQREDGQIFWYGTPTTFNIASASAGAEVASFISGVALPPGRYTVFRAVFTPPGSGASVIFGKNVTAAAPGSAQGLYLIVSDIKAARDELLGRGVEVSEVFHDAGDVHAGTDEPYLFGRLRVSGPDPDHRSYRS
jgi:hypothetical protein